MNNNFELVIVIPAYNEESRIPKHKYIAFIEKYNDVALCFVEDGSTDNTLNLLRDIQLSAPKHIKVIKHNKNLGKAAAVLTGLQFCHSLMRYQKIAYLDADLSTSLEECYDISKYVNTDTSFVFGSRIKKLDSLIERKTHRFLIGRCIATIISKQLGLCVYDTQCGCKIFSHHLAAQIFRKKFVSTWLFDVEIFHRIQNTYGKIELIRTSKEVPLRSWIDKDQSKVSLTYFFRMWFELALIRQNYCLRSNANSKTQEILSEALV